MIPPPRNPLSTFVIVPGAWDTPAVMEPLLKPLELAGHAVVVVDLPCEDADATLEQYADTVRAALPESLADVVLVGYSFGGFTASRIALGVPHVPVVYIAAWIPRPVHRCSISSRVATPSMAATRRQGSRRSVD